MKKIFSWFLLLLAAVVFTAPLAYASTDYRSRQLFKGSLEVDSQGYQIIEKFAHYLNGFPIIKDNNLIGLDLSKKRQAEFLTLTEDMAKEDIQFAMISLGLISDPTVYPSPADAHEIILATLQDLNQKNLLTVSLPKTSPKKTHVFLMRSPQDLGALKGIEVFYSYAGALFSETTKQWPTPPLKKWLLERLQDFRGWITLKAQIENLGGYVVELKDAQSKGQDYLSTFTTEAVATLPNLLLISAPPTRNARQAELEALTQAFTKLKLKMVTRADISLTGYDVQVGHHGIWLGIPAWPQTKGAGSYTKPAAFEQLNKLTSAPVIPVPLAKGSPFSTLDTALLELPNGEILYYPEALDTKFLSRLENTYKKANMTDLLIPLSKADAENMATQIIPVNDNLLVPANISANLAKKLEERGYKIIFDPTSDPILKFKRRLVLELPPDLLSFKIEKHNKMPPNHADNPPSDPQAVASAVGN